MFSLKNYLLSAASVLAIALLFSVISFTVSDPREAEAGAFPGSTANWRITNVATATVGPATSGGYGFIMGTTTGCTSRVVSTSYEPIELAFTSAFGTTTLSATAGFYQAASTTQVYDAEVFGCDTMYGWGVATSTITWKVAY